MRTGRDEDDGTGAGVGVGTGVGVGGVGGGVGEAGREGEAEVAGGAGAEALGRDPRGDVTTGLHEATASAVATTAARTNKHHERRTMTSAERPGLPG